MSTLSQMTSRAHRQRGASAVTICCYFESMCVETMANSSTPMHGKPPDRPRLASCFNSATGQVGRNNGAMFRPPLQLHFSPFCRDRLALTHRYKAWPGFALRENPSIKPRQRLGDDHIIDPWTNHGLQLDHLGRPASFRGSKKFGRVVIAGQWTVVKRHLPVCASLFLVARAAIRWIEALRQPNRQSATSAIVIDASLPIT